MPQLLQAKAEEEAKIGEWAESAKHHGKDTNAMICCSGAGVSCEPFPECCDCDHEQKTLPYGEDFLKNLDPDRRKPSFNEEWDT